MARYLIHNPNALTALFVAPRTDLAPHGDLRDYWPTQSSHPKSLDLEADQLCRLSLTGSQSRLYLDVFYHSSSRPVDRWVRDMLNLPVD